MTHRQYLLDASALLAVLFNEPGAEVVSGLIDDCSIHSVNLAETVRKVLQTGLPEDEAAAILDELNLEVHSVLTVGEAFAAGRLASRSRSLGLSLGDCVCLAVAAQTGQTVVTADRTWSGIAELAVKIVQIR